MQKRIFLIIAILFVAGSLSTVWFSSVFLRGYLENEESEKLKLTVHVLATMREVYRDLIIQADLFARDDKSAQLCPGNAISRISRIYGDRFGTEVEFNNVSDRPRNPLNQADAHDRQVMDTLRAQPKQQETQTRFIDPARGEMMQVSMPLRASKPCLTCHGKREAAPLFIQSVYATGYDYQEGDLRGILRARVPLSHVNRHVQDAQWRLAGILLLIVGGIFFGISWQLHTQVFARLKRLRASVSAYAQGDYRGRIPVDGPPEVSDVARALNQMANTIGQREAALREQGDELAEAQRLGHTGSWHWQGATGRLQVSDEAARLLGVPLDGANVEQLGAGISLADRLKLCATQDGDVATYETNYTVGNGGSRRQLKEIGRIEREASGAIRDIRATVIDLTEEYRRTEKLRIAARIFENTDEAIVLTDPFARIIDVNPAYCRLTGYDREEVLGKQPDISRNEQPDPGLFGSLLECLLATGHWQGEIWARRKNNDRYPQLVKISVIQDDAGGIAHFLATFSDITEIKTAEERLEQLAYFDPLTHLPNRLLARKRMKEELARCRRSSEQVAVFMVDLDDFKKVNDTLGHKAGDQLLIEISERFRHCVRDIDLVARLGGDEFLFLLVDIQGENQAAEAAARVIETVRRPVAIGNHEVYVGASVGVAIGPQDGELCDTLVKHADVAMYQAKGGGKNGFRFFKTEMNASSMKHLELVSDLHHAIDGQEFEMYYQPKYDACAQRLTGMEALIRWHHPRQGLVPPDEFIATTEETSLIVPIGDWLMRDVCRQCAAWQQAGRDFGIVSINLSPVQLRDDGLAERLLAIADDAGVAANRLEFEITENMLLDESERVVRQLKILRARGARISVDDFGKGYSSLGYLHRLPIDTLKIDREFVSAITPELPEPPVVSTIIALARNLGLKVIAEGVETHLQSESLQRMGCSDIQGYLYGRPMPAAEMDKVLDRPGMPASGDGR